MKKLMDSPRAEIVLKLLPRHIADEIFRLAVGRREGLFGIREIRIRRHGVCSLLVGREDIRLFSTVSDRDMDKIVEGVTGGALYAHRDSIAEGYINLPRGIRVGVCGSAAYDGEGLVGISNMTSLLFRIPTGECAFGEQLYSTYIDGIGRGLLIYSPPGVGKTTALRYLARMIGGKENKKVAVIDERAEFDEFEYIGCQVDILKGYKKSVGIEIATRTLSPEIIMIDEIGAEDASAVLSVIKCGIPIVATAHASDKEELLSKPALMGIFENRVFNVILGIGYLNGEYRLCREKI